jgi:class 3 adenylate cyclase
MFFICRQFTDTTECLQEEVMLFVNRIAFILHDIVVQCSGSANKNIGDAFLLAWKIDDKMSENHISILADKALLAFLKTLIEISRHQKYICAFSAGATERLLKRFPNYNVRIGSGLHVGWAIEGAIGSNRKIDASYLSPHVNFTEFLESSTKEYGIPLLLSEPFHKLLSPQAQKYCRQVDRIKRTNGDEPIGLFTYDCDMNIDWNDSSRHNKKGNETITLLSNAQQHFILCYSLPLI